MGCNFPSLTLPPALPLPGFLIPIFAALTPDLSLGALGVVTNPPLLTVPPASPLPGFAIPSFPTLGIDAGLGSLGIPTLVPSLSLSAAGASGPLAPLLSQFAQLAIDTSDAIIAHNLAIASGVPAAIAVTTTALNALIVASGVLQALILVEEVLEFPPTLSFPTLSLSAPNCPL